MDFKSYKEVSVNLNYSENEQMQKTIDSYSGMNQSEMQIELKAMYEKERSEGTIDMEKLNEIMKNMSGYMDDTQKTKMKNLIAMLGEK